MNLDPSPRPPLVGWLDNDATGLRNASAFLAGVSKPGTVDELGFGAVRQVYASLLFPATNTQMRRAIYFLTTPQLCARIQGGRASGRAAEGALTALENTLRQAFEASGATDGVIGISSREKLRRHPSSIYWYPLQELGILVAGLDRGSWMRGIGSWSAGPSVAEDDDGTAHEDDSTTGLWAGRALRSGPLRRGEVPAQLSPDLDEPMATYLRECFLGIDRRRGFASLMGELLHVGHVGAFGGPWDPPAPQALRQDIDDARRYSLFARGATLSYNHLVTQAKHQRVAALADPDCWVPAFEHWWEHARDELLAWELAGFARRLAVRARQLEPGAVVPSTRFCARWIGLLRGAVSPGSFLAEASTATLVRNQEATNRPGRARLTQDDRLHGWQEDYNCQARWLYQLLYRAPRASMLLDDINAGLARSS
jgi:hypothetical protein